MLSPVDKFIQEGYVRSVLSATVLSTEDITVPPISLTSYMVEVLSIVSSDNGVSVGCCHRDMRRVTGGNHGVVGVGVGAHKGRG